MAFCEFFANLVLTGRRAWTYIRPTDGAPHQRPMRFRFSRASRAFATWLTGQVEDSIASWAKARAEICAVCQLNRKKEKRRRRSPCGLLIKSSQTRLWQSRLLKTLLFPCREAGNSMCLELVKS